MHMCLFKDQSEQKMHENAIENLCRLYPGQEDYIRIRYIENLAPLIVGAKIRTYLTILATRKVKSQLEMRH